MSERISCNLCKADQTDLLLVKDSLNVVRCKVCGLIYTNPRHSSQVREAHYSQNYFDPWFKSKDITINKRFKRRLKEIEKLRAKRGKILDVGCGPGFFLKLAKDKGWQVFGVELSEYAAEYARKEWNLDIRVGLLEEVKFPDNYFDIICLWHVLEHVSDPLSFLQETKRILKKEGLLAIEIPNAGSFVLNLIKENWELLSPREHLYYFTFSTLKKLLDLAGFKIVSMKTFFWTSPAIIWGDLFKIFSWIRFLPLPKFVNGDVMVIYAENI